MYTPIAMKCTQEQFDAVNEKINGKEKYSKNYDYAFFNKYYNRLDQCKKGYAKENNLEIHEEWNEEIFLKACGIDVSHDEQIKIEDVMIDCTILNNDAIILIETIFKTKGHDIRYIRKPFSQGKDIIMADCENPDHKKLISFAKFKKLFNNQTSLLQQLQKAQDEVERLQNLIEEENKPKVGDWVKCKYNLGIIKVKKLPIAENWIKFDNPELIKLLEDEFSAKN